jgi:hypothetical protein
MVLTMAIESMTILVTKYFGSKQTVQLITFDIFVCFCILKMFLKEIIYFFVLK